MEKIERRVVSVHALPYAWDVRYQIRVRGEWDDRWVMFPKSRGTDETGVLMYMLLHFRKLDERRAKRLAKKEQTDAET